MLFIKKMNKTLKKKKFQNILFPLSTFLKISLSFNRPIMSAIPLSGELMSRSLSGEQVK